MTILVFAAHADDEVIGVGGTIAKLAKKEDVVVLVFSYGAGLAGRVSSWPPWISEEKLAKRRVFESKKAGEILGVKETIFLDYVSHLPIKFTEIQKHKIRDIISKYKPRKIFYHHWKDQHPDHLAVHRVIKELISEIKKPPEVHMYQINLFDFSKQNPNTIYDITEEYDKKIRALESFKSQIFWIKMLEPMIKIKSILYGKIGKFKYAECFYSE